MQILAAIKVNLAPIERRNSMVQLCSLKDKGDNLKISTKSSALGSAVVSVSDSSDAWLRKILQTFLHPQPFVAWIYQYVVLAQMFRLTSVRTIVK